MAEALYRKYRPQVFEDVVGQEPIQRTLKNAIAQDKVSHAYLFCGPRGTGKTTTARLLAKALLCETGPTPDPDGTCEDCRLIAEGAHPDVYELDAASRTGVENVREEIISRVHFAPTRGRYKVYIIDEVHMLSTAAFNALLKTLEEPPGHVVFILCTTDPQKVPETIHSRCQRFDFHRISPESMVARLGAICLAEGVEFEGEALDLVAQRADGGLRNALTSLEQIIAFENGKVTLAGAERLLGSIDSNDLVEIMSYIGRRDIANCFCWTAAYVETGADLADFVRDMAEHVRNLYILALVGDDAELDVAETARRELAAELAWFGPDRASRMLGVLGDLMAELKTTSNPRLAFEVALTRMVRPDSDLTLESLAERVEALESGYSSVAHVLPGEPVAIAEPAPASVEDTAPAPSTSFSGAGSGAFADSSDRSGGEALGAEAGRSIGAAADAPAMGASEPMMAAAPVDRATSARESQVSAREGERPAAEDSTAGSTATAAAVPPADGQSAGQSPAYSGAQPAEQPPAQPEIRPSAQPAAQASDSKLASLANPAALQRIWQAALATVKKQKAAHGVLFMGAKAVFDEAEGMLKIQFPGENTFAFGAVQKPDVQDALSEALAQAVGEEVPFCYEQVGAGQNVVKVVPVPASQQHQPQAVPIAVPEPVSEATPAPAPEFPTASGSAGATSPDSAAQPAPVGDFSVGEAPYDQVPYEDFPYDPVPYDELDQPAPSVEAAHAPNPSGESAQAADPVPGGAASGSMIDSASIGQAPVLTGDPTADAIPGETATSPAEIEALLQASFGNGVVLSEAD